jgi:hypothetical protein
VFTFHPITSAVNCSTAFQGVQKDVLPSPLSCSNLYCDFESQFHVNVIPVTELCVIGLELVECLSNRRTLRQKTETDSERDLHLYRLVLYGSYSGTYWFEMYHRHTRSNNMVTCLLKLNANRSQYYFDRHKG